MKILNYLFQSLSTFKINRNKNTFQQSFSRKCKKIKHWMYLILEERWHNGVITKGHRFDLSLLGVFLIRKSTLMRLLVDLYGLKKATRPSGRDDKTYYKLIDLVNDSNRTSALLTNVKTLFF